MKSNLSNHGGIREGQGRPSKYGVKTVVLRVPECIREDIEDYIRRRMLEFQSSSSSK
jgi:hypothetical protein